MALRPYWSGQIRMSLVSLPVNVFAALNRARQVPMHEIHRDSGERVRHQRMAGDEPIGRDDIVKGYEVAKGEYVLVEPEEIRKLKIPSKDTLDIVEFVPAGSIDAVYLDTPYFVAPDGKSAGEAFSVIRDALRETGMAGIGQLAIAGRERLCALRPDASGMILETLRYADEIRDAGPYFEGVPAKVRDKEQLDLARELIRRKSAEFDPARFHDHYHDALRALVDAKLHHRKPKKIAAGPRPAKVVDLMDALRRSLKEQPAASRSRTGRRATKAKRGRPAGRPARARRRA